MNASDKHNTLVTEVVKQLGSGTHSVPELMVVIESIILSALLLLVRLYGQKPKDASIYLEAALQRATERFAEKL